MSCDMQVACLLSTLFTILYTCCLYYLEYCLGPQESEPLADIVQGSEWLERGRQTYVLHILTRELSISLSKTGFCI